MIVSLLSKVLRKTDSAILVISSRSVSKGDDGSDMEADIANRALVVAEETAEE